MTYSNPRSIKYQIKERNVTKFKTLRHSRTYNNSKINYSILVRDRHAINNRTHHRTKEK